MKTPSKKTVRLQQMIAVISLYIAFQIFSDILAIKVATLFGLTFTVGLLLYPFTFTLRDMVHKLLGKSGARAVVIWAGVLNLIMVLLFQMAIMLPAGEHWFIQNEYATVLGSIWRIVLASISAEIIGELVDTEVYSLFVNKVTRKYQWARVLISNFTSAPIDSIIFVFIAFYGVLPISVLWSMIGVQVLVKIAITIISTPSVYLVKDQEGVQM